MEDSELKAKIDQLTESLRLLGRQFNLDVEAAAGDKEKIRALATRQSEALDSLRAEMDLLRAIDCNRDLHDPPPSNT
jgi:hypothetical protein